MSFLKPSLLFLSIVVGVLVSACDSPPEISNTALINNPNEHVPLAGILSFTSDTPVRATLTITDGEKSQTVTPDPAFSLDHKIPVLGLRPGKTHSVVLTVTDEKEKSMVVDTLEITTPALPDDFPPIRLTAIEKDALEPGITLLNLFRWTGPFDDDMHWGLLIGLDEDGEVVWYYKADYGIAEGRRMRNGNLFFGSHSDGRMYEVDMLGNELNIWQPAGVMEEIPENSIAVDTDCFHHDVIELASGNFLGLGLEVIRYEDFPLELPPGTKRGAVNTANDEIIEFARDGSTVRKYSVANILDPERLGEGSMSRDFYKEVYKNTYDSLDLPIDLTHSNAIYYIEQEDAALVSSYNHCVIYKVDMKTGEIIWMLGDDYGWKEPWSDKLLTAVGDVTWPCHQHGLEMTPRGTLLMFDNGASRSMPGQEGGLTPDKMYSRAVEYRINEAEGTVEEVWTYGPEQEHFSSVFICDADYMPETGNVLITDGGRFMDEDGNPMNTFGGHQWGRVFEVTYEEDPRKVWEIEIKDPEQRYSIYRAQKLKSLYPKLDEPTG